MYACLLFLHTIDDLMVHCVLCSLLIYIVMTGRPRTSRRPFFFYDGVEDTSIFQNLIPVGIRYVRQSFVV